MKTRFLRMGKSSLSLVLSILMIVSTVLVGSSVTVDSNIVDDVSVADVSQNISTTDDAVENIDQLIDTEENTEVIEANELLDTSNSKELSTNVAESTKKIVNASGATAPESSGNSTFNFIMPSTWTSPSCWVFKADDSGSHWAGSLPGESTSVSNGVYSITVDTDTYTQVIFAKNTNWEAQTKTFTFASAGNKNYFLPHGSTNPTNGKIDGEWVSSDWKSDNFKTNNNQRFYFRWTDGWSPNRLYAYTFAPDTGVSVDIHSNGNVNDGFYVDVDLNKYNKIIFYNTTSNTDSSWSKQTENLDLYGHDNRLYYDAATNAWVDADGNSEDEDDDDSINIDDGKTYLLYYKNSDDWTPCYAYLWEDGKSGSWPGIKMKSVNGYSNLYAADISDSSYSNCNRLIFHDNTNDQDGTWVNQENKEYDNSAHKSIDLVFDYSKQTYSTSGSQVVWYPGNKFNGNSEATGGQRDSSGTLWILRNFTTKSLSDITGVDTSEPALGTNEVRVYAKSGTIRDQGSSSTAQYNKYSELADTTIKVDGTSISEENGYGFTYYKKTGWWSYNYSDELKGNRLTLAHAEKGTKINITTEIKKSYRNKYYVKAFCINGKSFGTISESEAISHKDTGIYTYTYTIPKNVDAVEITPIYFYFEEGEGNSFITFNVEDFDGEVRKKWGNTIACFAWYQNGDEGATVVSEISQNALGGYPGQPMVSDGGSYYIQVPKEYKGLGKIKGITLNNYVWDDVHGYYLRQYEDFNGLDNVPDASFNKVSDHRKKANAQTYDYDDFVALSELDDVDEIIFSFKYRTYDNHNAEYGDSYAGDGNKPKTSDITVSATDAEYRLGTGSDGKVPYNGWNALVDYDDVVVDLFGNQLTQYTDTQVLTELDNSEKLFVVSDGYINYYTKSSDSNDQVHDKYLGEYATKWYVYSLDNSNTEYTYRGALPPSAFITTAELAKYDMIIADDDTNDYGTKKTITETNAKKQFAKYLAGDATYGDAIHEAAVNKLFNTYKTLFNSYKNVPVVITYESALNSNGRYNANSDNWGYRNDGRWYYSRATGNIHANTKILIYDPTDTTSATVTYNGVKYIEDSYATKEVENEDGTTSTVTLNYGETTGATACFNDSALGLKLNGETYVEVARNKADQFKFSATKTSETKDKYNKDVIYVFKGWYLETGGNVLNDVTVSTSGSRKMNSIATFVAVYEKVNVRSLIVNHNLYANESLTSADPTPHNGTGTTYVESITITDKDGKTLTKFTANESNTLQTETDEDTVNYLKNNENKILVTLRTVPANSDTKLEQVYQHNGNTDETKPSYDEKGTSMTYEYNVGDLFGTDTSVSKVVTLNLFSDLSSRKSTIVVNFKYYDRALENNTTANIANKETVLSYTLTDIENYNQLEEAIADINASGKFADNNKVKVADIDNLLDEYIFWNSLTDAKSSFSEWPYYTYDDNGKLKDSKYGNVPNIALEYHTDNYSMPKTGAQTLAADNEQWVTYYNLKGEPIKNIIDGDATNNNVTVTELSSVTVWGFNTPKPYNLKVYTDPTITVEEDGKQVTKFKGEYIAPVTNTNLYTFATEKNYSGFYNQRVGVKDPDSEAGKTSDKAVAYLMGYYGLTEDNGNTGIAYTGDVVDAPLTAKTSSEDTTVYKFVGWYTLSNGSYVKVSSDRTYGNRITSDLTLYAMYQPESVIAEAEPTNNVGTGVSVTANGIHQGTLDVDNFIVEDKITGEQTQKIRLNTQLNVYYDGAMINNDPDIKQVAVIYVNLSDDDLKKDDDGNIVKDSNGNPVVAEKTINTIKGWLTKNSDLLIKGDSVRKSGTIKFENDNILIVDTYDVGTDINLTNKNRTQFILPMSESLYDGTYSKLIAFAAIQYEGDVNGDEETTESDWIISDNYVSYVHG